ncbi:tetraacyldisaccharide 4'-kinase [Roseateles sp. BYS180W]|uniref:Tetraacyldisaccharide 4'-kinase n=1 Tax=Roseateles rivi TaxID=3299028 RepID=A0ABW7FYP2_9BURK
MSLSDQLARRIERSWQSNDWLAQLLRPLGALHHAMFAVRALAYRCGLAKVEVLPVPVLVVGNWVVGGAGKTPTMLALLQHLSAQGVSCGVVSRGYGRQSHEVRLVQPHDSGTDVGDEPLLIALRSRVPVAVGADRVAAARALLQAHPGIQLLLSDDGLQHWRLPRALSVLVFDERGVGNGRMLPAGPLRQPGDVAAWPGHGAARLVLYNAKVPSTALPGHLAHRAPGGLLTLRQWSEQPLAQGTPLSKLQGRTLLAAAGIANPQRFFDLLREQGLSFEALPLPDHASLDPLPWNLDTETVVTEKDAAKLRHLAHLDPPIWVLRLDFRPDPEFFAALQARLQPLLPHGPKTD